ncbi:formyltetrahydrofolate deformylase [Chlorobium sp. N1]|uniref:formyltetrahydrofolate deformylase n=1 Tax=Chlorobium sp. N1 TaxID=2491138 RepID=UPI00103FD4C4|nr:formyltetrahydrofolate deformylase [Chlorobium sp. N1]TCD47638.1 formyltetrahydrofolate deformylase [Chlorobium sp. N1]
MHQEPSPAAILLLSCRDRSGLVSRISHFIYERGGNIIDLDEHVDAEAGMFFIRVSWSTEGLSIPVSRLGEAFRPLGLEFEANWSIRFTGRPTRLALFVSRYDHCLQELLWRYSMGEFQAEIPLVISNHPDLGPLAAQYGIPFHHFPLTAGTRPEVEAREQELLRSNNVDAIVLARYMQVLSPEFARSWHGRAINIHHSFLPAFVGGNPYRQAYERGVKIIGATSHYVTEELDQGPIIEQDIMRVSHRDTLSGLIRRGRDLERLVLARAVRLHCEHRILLNGRKTIVFD